MNDIIKEIHEQYKEYIEKELLVWNGHEWVRKTISKKEERLKKINQIFDIENE